VTYDCIGPCGRTLPVTASVSKPRAVTICEDCMRATTDFAEIDKKLHPNQKEEP
jgi:hypothetical protein